MTSNTAPKGVLPYFVKDRIDRLLINLGGTRPLTYEELADRMDMDKGQLSKIVNGKQRVRLDTLERIAAALDVPLSVLFDGASRPPVRTPQEFVSLMTTYHQDLLMALGELTAAGASDAAHLLVEADRRLARPNRRERAG